jgi:hypothetical protein
MSFVVILILEIYPKLVTYINPLFIHIEYGLVIKLSTTQASSKSVEFDKFIRSILLDVAFTTYKFPPSTADPGPKIDRFIFELTMLLLKNSAVSAPRSIV